MEISTGSVLALQNTVRNLQKRDRAGGGLGIEATSQLAYTKHASSTVWAFSRRMGGEGCWESWPGRQNLHKGFLEN